MGEHVDKRTWGRSGKYMLGGNSKYTWGGNKGVRAMDMHAVKCEFCGELAWGLYFVPSNYPKLTKSTQIFLVLHK